MPIHLKEIPEKISLPLPPDKFRWLIVVILLMVVGAIISLALWPATVSTHSLWFWFCSLIVPLSVGLICFALRLRHFENERDRILYWNHMHQQKYDELVKEGQRAMGMLGMAYITPLVSNKLSDALLKGCSPLQTQYDKKRQRALTSASLSPLLQDLTTESYLSRLERLLIDVMRMLQPELAEFTGNLCVRIRHDGILPDDEIRSMWQRLFPQFDRVLHPDVGHGDDGVMWLDKWLDDKQDMLVLSVQINLFLETRNNQCESVSALLLASPEWLQRHEVKPLSKIHRPVVLTDEDEAINDTARWGLLLPGDSFTFWRSQVGSEALSATLLAMDKAGFTWGGNDDHLLDESFGLPGAGVGNITLICASENAAVTNEAQWLMVGDKSTHMAIVRPA